MSMIFEQPINQTGFEIMNPLLSKLSGSVGNNNNNISTNHNTVSSVSANAFYTPSGDNMIVSSYCNNSSTSIKRMKRSDGGPNHFYRELESNAEQLQQRYPAKDKFQLMKLLEDFDNRIELVLEILNSEFLASSTSSSSPNTCSPHPSLHNHHASVFRSSNPISFLDPSYFESIETTAHQNLISRTSSHLPIPPLSQQDTTENTATRRILCNLKPKNLKQQLQQHKLLKEQKQQHQQHQLTSDQQQLNVQNTFNNNNNNNNRNNCIHSLDLGDNPNSNFGGINNSNPQQHLPSSLQSQQSQQPVQSNSLSQHQQQPTLLIPSTQSTSSPPSDSAFALQSNQQQQHVQQLQQQKIPNQLQQSSSISSSTSSLIPSLPTTSSTSSPSIASSSSTVTKQPTSASIAHTSQSSWRMRDLGRIQSQQKALIENVIVPQLMSELSRQRIETAPATIEKAFKYYEDENRKSIQYDRIIPMTDVLICAYQKIHKRNSILEGQVSDLKKENALLSEERNRFKAIAESLAIMFHNKNSTAANSFSYYGGGGSGGSSGAGGRGEETDGDYNDYSQGFNGYNRYCH